MRSLLATILAALALAGLTSLSAAAATGGNVRDAGRGARIAEHGTPLHLARAVFGDDDAARPRGRQRADDGWNRARQAKPRQARTAKHARRHARKHRARQRSVMRRSARLAVRSYPLWKAPAGSGQHGVASYYWQGQRVASGGVFNPNAMTAAHRTLPFGTRVRVTHLGNGRTVEVRINDRGPYIAGRIIDLSRGAAGIIGMHGQGVARVRVTVLGR